MQSFCCFIILCYAALGASETSSLLKVFLQTSAYCITLVLEYNCFENVPLRSYDEIN
jgi:hypothetical protein